MDKTERAPIEDQRDPGEPTTPGHWDAAWGTDLTQRLKAIWAGKWGVVSDEVISGLDNRVSRCAHGGKH